MARVLVTGMDTALGANLALRFAQRNDVLGLYDRHAWSHESLALNRWQVDQPASIEGHLRDFDPEWLLHVGPLSASSWDTPPCSADAERESQRVRTLAQVSSECGCRLAVLSSDVVFAGPRLFHDENSPPGATSHWAQQVLRMEQALSDSGALIVRTHAYGWGGTESNGFAAQAAESLLGGLSPATDGRRHATPLLATDLADLLLRCFEQRLTGLYHLAGAERTSPFRFVAELALALGVEIPACSAERSAERSAEETSLSSMRARRALGVATPMLRAGLERFAAQAHNGWRDALQVDRHPARHEVAA